HEAQDVGEQSRSNRRERGEVRAVRRLQLQNHDRDDDSDHAVAERFEPAFPHDEKLTQPSHAHDRSPHRVRWGLIFAVWIPYGLLGAAQEHLSYASGVGDPYSEDQPPADAMR